VYGGIDYDFRIIGLDTSNHVAIQSRASNQYWTIAAALAQGNQVVQAVAESVGANETFAIINNGDGTVSFTAPDGTPVYVSFFTLAFQDSTKTAARFAVTCR
jgi:hypothetical protein